MATPPLSFPMTMTEMAAALNSMSTTAASSLLIKNNNDKVSIYKIKEPREVFA